MILIGYGVFRAMCMLSVEVLKDIVPPPTVRKITGNGREKWIGQILLEDCKQKSHGIAFYLAADLSGKGWRDKGGISQRNWNMHSWDTGIANGAWNQGSCGPVDMSNSVNGIPPSLGPPTLASPERELENYARIQLVQKHNEERDNQIANADSCGMMQGWSSFYGGGSPAPAMAPATTRARKSFMRKQKIVQLKYVSRLSKAVVSSETMVLCWLMIGTLRLLQLHHSGTNRSTSPALQFHSRRSKQHTTHWDNPWHLTCTAVYSLHSKQHITLWDNPQLFTCAVVYSLHSKHLTCNGVYSMHSKQHATHWDNLQHFTYTAVLQLAAKIQRTTARYNP